MKVKLGSPCFIDMDRDPTCMGDISNARKIGSDATVGGTDEGNHLRIRVLVKRSGDLLRRDAKANIQFWMQRRRYIYRVRAGENECH